MSALIPANLDAASGVSIVPSRTGTVSRRATELRGADRPNACSLSGALAYDSAHLMDRAYADHFSRKSKASKDDYVSIYMRKDEEPPKVQEVGFDLGSRPFVEDSQHISTASCSPRIVV